MLDHFPYIFLAVTAGLLENRIRAMNMNAFGSYAYKCRASDAHVQPAAYMIFPATIRDHTAT